jgi:hypothetical protein
MLCICSHNVSLNLSIMLQNMRLYSLIDIGCVLFRTCVLRAIAAGLRCTNNCKASKRTSYGYACSVWSALAVLYMHSVC